MRCEIRRLKWLFRRSGKIRANGYSAGKAVLCSDTSAVTGEVDVLEEEGLVDFVKVMGILEMSVFY